MAQGSRVALLVLILCLSAFIVGPVPAHAVTLQINGSGILTGATGVNVGGILYDVEFVDGTCAAVFTGCDEVSDFVFQTHTGATAASQALSEQVFVDDPLLGSFDNAPALTHGCNNTSSIPTCTIRTPYATFFTVNPNTIDELHFVAGTSFTNVPDQHCCDFVQTGGVGFNTDPNTFDTTVSTALTNARWTTSTQVPEPATSILFGLGLAALILWDYRHRQGRRTWTPLK